MKRITFYGLCLFSCLSCAEKSDNSAAKEKSRSIATSDTLKPEKKWISFSDSSELTKEVESVELFEAEKLSVEPMRRTMVSSGQFSDYVVINYQNCEFQLVRNQEGKTTYMATSDKKFNTAEKYHVGTTFSELSSSEKERLAEMPGWGFYIKLNSGWSLGFCEGPSCTSSLPTPTSEVKWIFKRE